MFDQFHQILALFSPKNEHFQIYGFSNHIMAHLKSVLNGYRLMLNPSELKLDLTNLCRSQFWTNFIQFWLYSPQKMIFFIFLLSNHMMAHLKSVLNGYGLMLNLSELKLDLTSLCRSQFCTNLIQFWLYLPQNMDIFQFFSSATI